MITKQFVFFLVCLWVGWQTLHADEFKIRMNAPALTDPILEWQAPVITDDSELQINNSGILVQQVSKNGKKVNPSIGFRVLVPTTGNFHVQLSLDCLELQPPKDGWGQGIVLKANVADSKKTVLTVGLASRPMIESNAFVAIETQSMKNPTYRWEPVSFRKGVISLERNKNIAICSMTQDGKTIFTHSMPVPVDDIASFEVWCTRQDEDFNTNAKYLLEEISLEGDSHRGLRPVNQGFTWQFILNGILAGTIAAIGFKWYRQR